MKISVKTSFLYACLLAMVLVSCKKEIEKISDTLQDSSSTEVPPVKADSIKQDSMVKKESIPAEMKDNGFYGAFILPKDKKLRDSMFSVFSKKYTEKERYAILALNRLDSKNKWNADTLVVPVKIDTTLISYSPFPMQLDVLSNVKKFVVFSYPIQAYGVYSNGSLVKWGPTSMGKKAAQTKRGLTFANWKKKLAISTVSSEWKLPYNFNIFNSEGIGWHQYDLPGYPASHSCLRLLMKDAQWLYSYADTWILNPGGATTKARGTAVMVFGDYKWGGRKPWRKLLNDPNANNISVEEMTRLIEPNVDRIIREQSNREKIADSIRAAKALEIETKESEKPAEVPSA
ncbi:lipoprotein-anchoring transpeptidase ErfK/SrfK [Chryseobacterium defluvii]|uniref:Lipoprotein-anchoring transpeptidase ErfK/SrfK n=1 Tax=Chryseobacterium defluvii TaxID=160396 RepID=A0A840KG12_9FLAO|nr:L,D-transpeptidase [Chryseobacterium defluvii]MBB4805872.1 lipoprotein-anchoring transpeptidase ErfK/SrfK [Chryseobacterium defluvii]